MVILIFELSGKEKVNCFYLAEFFLKLAFLPIFGYMINYY
jgi:hypothetical protein